MTAQDFLNLLAALNGAPGRIEVPPGTYDFTSSFTLHAYQTIEGVGGAPPGTGVVFSFDSKWWKQASAAVLVEGSQVRIAGIAFSTADGHDGGLTAAITVTGGADSVIIERCSFHAFSHASYASDADHRSIAQRVLDGTPWIPAIRIEAGSYYCVVRDCSFKNNDVAVHLRGSNHAQVTGGVVDGGCISAIVLESVTSATVSMVAFDTNSRHAHIEGIDCHSATILANRLESSGKAVRALGQSWHLSFDEASANNSVVSNPFATSDLGTGHVLVRNPGATGVRWRWQPLPVGGGWGAAAPADLSEPEGAYLSTSVPSGWDWQADLQVRLVLAALTLMPGVDHTVSVSMWAQRDGVAQPIADVVATGTTPANGTGMRISTLVLTLPASAIARTDTWLLFLVRGLATTARLLHAELGYRETDAQLDLRA